MEKQIKTATPATCCANIPIFIIIITTVFAFCLDEQQTRCEKVT